jgi:5-methylcytosine-specific restriction endonuclease McrA
MYRRVEFTKKTKKAAWLRASGRCQCQCGCRISLDGKVAHYDHINPETFSHDASLSNCQVLCVNCHDDHKTKIDRPTIAKSNRISARHIGIRPDRTIRAWRKFDGTPVYKSRKR